MWLGIKEILLMKINIYYGGRGLIDDPTLYVINKMQSVLEELHVEVERFNLYELKNSITTLPQTLKSTDGIVLATTVEWHGIGGYMTQFLDACWLYGDKEKISKIYMCPIVMSTTYGEREGKLDLSVAWEILGGLPCSGICGYIADTSIFDSVAPWFQLGSSIWGAAEGLREFNKTYGLQRDQFNLQRDQFEDNKQRYWQKWERQNEARNDAMM